jgi:o-succinylbenzoate synthase
MDSMRIEQITLNHLSMPLVSPFETSFGRSTDRECLIITMQAEGITGYGECVADRDPGYSYETTGTAWHILKEFIFPSLLGQDVADADDFQRRVESIRGHHLAKAGVEMAVWDLLGKRDDKSLKQMLGGGHSQVAVGVSVGLQANPETLVQTVGNYISQGYHRIKIKIKPGRDILDTVSVRKAYPDVKLQVDANSAYTLETAETLLPLDDLNLLLIEQPLYEDDIWEHHYLQKKFHTAICLDESILTLRHARAALEMGSCKIINIKAGRVGGLTQAVDIHDMCHAKGIPVWCGGMLETGVGRASNLALASLPGFVLPADISASDRYYKRDITNEQFSLNLDSTITVPDKPGLGITIDDDALRQFTLAELIFKR